jgi:N,N'-diacetyllegionaminate synthase
MTQRIRQIGPIRIADRAVGAGLPCFVIAEVGQAHDGSLGACHAYIDAAARAGADAIKFQTHIANEESSPDEPWRVKFSPQDETRFAYWKRMEFPATAWAGLAQHAADKGLIFLSSAFSAAAVELLEKLDMPAWKVASGESTSLPLLRRMAQTEKPVLLSSGMSSWRDLDRAVAEIRRWKAPLAMFQATSAYPCPSNKIGLNLIPELMDRYACPVGLSDHSATIATGIAAVTLGASLLEVHITFSRECFGPDTSSSLTTAELRQLVDGIRFVEQALAHPVDKDALAEELSELRTLFGKSVVAARDLDAGSTLRAEDLALRKPATGIPAAELDSLIDRRLRRAIAANSQISVNDLV